MKRAPFRGLNAILFKEFITVLRDPMTLFFMLFPPLIEMIAFGYALDNDVKHMPMVILNEDRTSERRPNGERDSEGPCFRRHANPAAFHARSSGRPSGAGPVAH